MSTSTPDYLTLQDTGSQEPPLTRSTSPYKKPQVAFYPHVNSSNKPQKPFSRSAAKRESVMALGSIEHLQHYFTKTGIAAKKECVSISPDCTRLDTLSLDRRNNVKDWYRLSVASKPTSAETLHLQASISRHRRLCRRCRQPRRHPTCV